MKAAIPLEIDIEELDTATRKLEYLENQVKRIENFNFDSIAKKVQQVKEQLSEVNVLMDEIEINQDTPSVVNVARRIGKGSQFVILGIEDGSFPVGSVQRSENGRANVYISPKLLYEFTGMKMCGYSPEPVYLITPELFNSICEEEQERILKNVKGIKEQTNEKIHTNKATAL